MTKKDKEWLINLDEKLTENEAHAVIFIKNNEKMTNGDYQKLNNVNRDKALAELRTLISKGMIKSNGIGSGTYYTLNEEKIKVRKDINQMKDINTNDEIISDEKEIASNEKEIAGNEKEIAGNEKEIAGNEKLNNKKEIIEYLLKNKKITNKDVRNITGLKESASRELLQEMVIDNLIEPKGENRGRYYIKRELK